MSHLRHLSPIETKIREQFYPEDPVLSLIQHCVQRVRPACDVPPSSSANG